MRKLLLLLIAVILLSPVGLLKSEERAPLWEAKRFDVLSVYKQTMLIGYITKNSSVDIYEKIDLVDKATGKSLWNEDKKDICNFLENKHVGLGITYYNNLVFIVYADSNEPKVETTCFDVLTGSKLWKNHELLIMADTNSFFEKRPKVICIKENIVYATYFKVTKGPVVKLLEFDIVKGEIISSNDIKLHYDLDGDTRNRTLLGYLPLIVKYNNVFLFIEYSGYIQCYDLKNKILIWKMLKVINTLFLDRNNVVLSLLEDYECGMTCTYRFLNIKSGKQVFEITGYENAKLFNEFLYIQQIRCNHNVDTIKNGYITKIDTTNAIISKEIPTKTRLCSFSKNFLISSDLTKIKTKSNSNELKLSIFDQDLNEVETITKITDAQYCYIDALDDVYTISYSTKNKNISKTELYALPDYENNKKKSYASLLIWLIQYLLNRILYP